MGQSSVDDVLDVVNSIGEVVCATTGILSTEPLLNHITSCAYWKVPECKRLPMFALLAWTVRQESESISSDGRNGMPRATCHFHSMTLHGFVADDTGHTIPDV